MPTICKQCKAEIHWVKMDTGKWMPCDPDPIHFDDVEKVESLIGEDGIVYRVNPDHRYPQDDSYGYMPHWKTCPAAEKFRRSTSK